MKNAKPVDSKKYLKNKRARITLALARLEKDNLFYLKELDGVDEKLAEIACYPIDNEKEHE